MSGVSSLQELLVSPSLEEERRGGGFSYERGQSSRCGNGIRQLCAGSVWFPVDIGLAGDRRWPRRLRCVWCTGIAGGVLAVSQLCAHVASLFPGSWSLGCLQVSLPATSVPELLCGRGLSESYDVGTSNTVRHKGWIVHFRGRWATCAGIRTWVGVT